MEKIQVFLLTLASLSGALQLSPIAAVSAFATFAGANGKGFAAGRRNKDDSTSLFVFDRFRPQCPADPASIRQFAPSLIPDDEEAEAEAWEEKHQDDDVWVAVFRSHNNAPSVLVKDEFLHAMRSATDTGISHKPSATSNNPGISVSTPASNSAADTAPVAVARLRRTTMSSATMSNRDGDDDDAHSDFFILDSMRCILKKETTDAACDGGSEHTEALATAIDALLVHYLEQIQGQRKSNRFEGILRAKGTLVASPILEDRGFREVTELSRDMTTHTSSLDDSLERYAARSLLPSCGPQARQRAIQIVSNLGRIDRAADFDGARQAIRQRENDDGDGDNPNDVDPWSAMKRFI